jgi:hypothetical protein
MWLTATDPPCFLGDGTVEHRSNKKKGGKRQNTQKLVEQPNYSASFFMFHFHRSDTLQSSVAAIGASTQTMQPPF